MDIRQLNYFVQVADCGSYSKAAQKLFISQPALSKTIKNMEEEMGFTFFYTHQRKQLLTEAGQAFYDKTVHFLKEYDALMRTEYENSNIVSGHLTIGISAGAGPALFAHISPKFSTIYPMIDISLVENASSLIKEEVLKKNIDAAIVDLYYINKDEIDQLDVFEIAESDLVAVVSTNNPLAEKQTLSYDELDGKKVIFFQNEGSSIGVLSVDLRVSRARPKIVMTSSQWHLIFDLVQADYGITIAPYYIYSRLKNSKIKAILFDDPSSRRSIALITKKGENRSKALNAFIDFTSDKKVYYDLSSRLTPDEPV
ncbi:MAG: LysR family transcriptional regulator [Firmicutes bacterium]|nr:LysR family transcriptional regulator [Bacillota bacterium]